MTKRVLDKDCIQTHIEYFDFVKIDPNLIHAEDIAHSLSKICRFNGHLKQFYSVAQHCCFIHDRILIELPSTEENRRLALYGLLHDAHEAYVGDVVRPMKYMLKEKYGFDFNDLCDRIDSVVFDKFGLPEFMTKEEADKIKLYDNVVLFTEKVHLFVNKYEWGWDMHPYSWSDFAKYTDNSIDWKKEYLDRLNAWIEK